MSRTSYYILGFLISFTFSRCEDEVDTSLNSKSYPIVYSIFNKIDPTNKVYVTRSFSGDGGALNDAKINDSVYFDNIDVEIVLRRKFIVGSDKFSLTLVTENNKDDGLFLNPNVQFFLLEADISDYDWYQVKVFINNSTTFFGSSRLIDPPVLISPKHNKSTISLLPDNPFIISWYTDPDFCYDVEVNFEILSSRNSSTYIDTITYIKTGIFSDDSFQYYKAVITPELFLSLLNQYFNSNEIDYRKFLNIVVTVHMANKEYVDYLAKYNWEKNYAFFMDFDTSSFIGVTSSKSRATISNLEFDRKTQTFIVDDPEFKEFKFVFW